MHDRIHVFVEDTDLPRYAEGENSFDYQFILGKKTCYLKKNPSIDQYKAKFGS